MFILVVDIFIEEKFFQIKNVNGKLEFKEIKINFWSFFFCY